jgi:predicted ATP-dependent protease
LSPFDGVIGQERALGAIEVGLGVEARGFNLFLTGLAGTGRLTTIRSILDSMALSQNAEIPPDQLYVTNFGTPDYPLHISLPAGKGKEFAETMKQLVSSLGTEIKLLYEGPAFEQSRKAIEEESTSKQRAVLTEFEKLIEPEGLVLFQLQGIAASVQLQVIPKIKDKPVRPHLLDQLVEKEEITKEEADNWRIKIAKYATLLEVEVKRIRLAQTDALKKVENLEVETATPLIKQKVAEIREKFPFPQLSDYFTGLETSLLQNAQRFRNLDKSDSAAGAASGINGLQALFSGASKSDSSDFKAEYNVNLLVDNSQTKTRPVVFETHPTFKNLFGTIERVFTRFGIVQTDLSNIKAGSLLKANGGFLVLNARDVLSEFAVWPTLKRMLRNGMLEIQTSDMFFSTAMKPAPIPMSVKVVMIGENYMYNLLSAYDEDFAKIFKVKVGYAKQVQNSRDFIR